MKNAVLAVIFFSGMAASAAAPENGKIWYDTAGHPVNAHGGGVLAHEGRYYLYGEHKVYGRAGNKAHVGVHMYSSDDLSTWKDEGGGALINQNPHQLDLWQWLCGMPTKVRAFCHEGKWHDVEIEDDVTIYAEYENGATGVFVTSTGDFPGSNRLEITMDKAKLVCEKGEKITLFELEEGLTENIRTCENGFAS